jgi:uncharacterized RDD family membrane protein YckC
MGAHELVNGHQQPLLQRVIVIRTPENIELNYALAGAGSRAAAYFIDILIMFFAGQLFVNLLTYLLAGLMRVFAGSELWAGAVASLLFFAVYNGYFIFFEWLLNGQTPGKRLLHIRVIQQGGYALRFFDTLVRNLLRVIDFIPLFYGVGLVSLLLSRYCQRLGDLVAGTLVVHQEPVATGSLLEDLPGASASDESISAAQLAVIPGDVFTLVSEFLGRRSELAPRPRQEIGAELVDLVRRTSGINPPARQSTENFLAALMRQAEQIAQSSFPPPTPA